MLIFKNNCIVIFSPPQVISLLSLSLFVLGWLRWQQRGFGVFAKVMAGWGCCDYVAAGVGIVLSLYDVIILGLVVVDLGLVMVMDCCGWW